MLDPKDLKAIKAIVKDEISGSEKRLRGEISGSEKRLRGEIEEKVSASEKRIITEVGNFVNDIILPMIDEKADKSDVARLERKIDSFNLVNLENKSKIKQIKSHIGLTTD